MKMKEQILCLTLLLLISMPLFFFSCSGDRATDALLSEAESVIDSLPHKAYDILLETDSIADFNRAQRARWNLLITRAMDKAYMEHTTDSLIRETVAYFEKREVPQELMLSYYTMGRVSHELGDVPMAQKYYLKALEPALTLRDSSYLTRINHHLGFNYILQDLPEEALPYLKAFERYATDLNDREDIRSANRDIGRAYSLLDQPDSALLYYRKALTYFPKNKRVDLLNEIIPLYLNQAHYDSAFIYIQEIGELPAGSLSTQSNLVIGQYFAQTDQPDSARHYLMKCLDAENLHTQAAACFHLYQIARDMKDWENYLLYHTKYETLRDSIMKNAHTETLLQLNALYNFEKKEAELAREELAHLKTKQLITWIAIIAIATLLLLVYYFCQSRKNKKELREQRSRWKLLKEEQEKERLNRENLEKLKELRNSAIYQRFKEPGNKTITFDDKKNLMIEVDKVYPGFNGKLYNLYPQIDYHELLICYMIRCDIPIKSICTIMGKTEQSISNKRKSLGEKMFGEKCGAKDFDEKIKQIY